MLDSINQFKKLTGFMVERKEHGLGIMLWPEFSSGLWSYSSNFLLRWQLIWHTVDATVTYSELNF